MDTIFVKPKQVERRWFLIDAAGRPLGRVATQVATILRGKNKPQFVPHQEVGDYVIVINAGKVVVTGRKLTDKEYHWHSGYPGGLRTETLGKLLERKPTSPLEIAIRGMLPKNSLGRKLFNNVKVYAGDSHPHGAQQPVLIA